LAGSVARRVVSARVLIVEDHPVLRNVIRVACDSSDHLEVAGEASTGEEALEAYRTLAPDLVLLDLSLPDMDGLEVARRLRREAPQPPRILVLTGRGEEETVFECIRAGVDGYLEKTAGVRFITVALERLAAGERLFTPEQERAAIEGLGRLARRAREASELGASVTPRELEVLRFLSRGLTMGQTAHRLGVSTRTVEAHVANVYRKLGVSNRVQALAKARDLRLIELP
jgi:DNA-binding NarL/FixJ family response regulator